MKQSGRPITGACDMTVGNPLKLVLAFGLPLLVGDVFQQAWPEYDENAMKEDTIEIAVQINGKTKGTITIGAKEEKDSVLAKAKDSIADKLVGNVVKEIYVPGRIVNIVMK